MKEKKNTLGTKLLMTALFLGVAAYFLIEALQFLDDPLTIILAYNYQVESTL